MKGTKYYFWFRWQEWHFSM